MTTIKIKPSHPSQGEFVLIEKQDFDPSRHELLEGESLDIDSTVGGVPTLAELRVGHDQLLARKEQLDELELMLSQRANDEAGREQALAQREAAVDEREKANEIEAQRLRDEAAGLQVAKDAAVAQAQVAAASAAAVSTTEKPAKAAKA